MQDLDLAVKQVLTDCASQRSIVRSYSRNVNGETDETLIPQEARDSIDSQSLLTKTSRVTRKTTKRSRSVRKLKMFGIRHVLLSCPVCLILQLVKNS